MDVPGRKASSMNHEYNRPRGTGVLLRFINIHLKIHGLSSHSYIVAIDNIVSYGDTIENRMEIMIAFTLGDMRKSC